MSAINNDIEDYQETGNVGCIPEQEDEGQSNKKKYGFLLLTFAGLTGVCYGCSQEKMSTRVKYVAIGSATAALSIWALAHQRK
jgi:hypothetical protein